MMLPTQHYFRTHDGNDSPDTHQYTLFLGEEMMLSVGAYSEKGKRRPTNQDNYLLRDGTLVVADGAGGHSIGETASELVCDVFETQQDLTAAPSRGHQLSDIVRQAHESLLEEAERRPKELGKQDGLCATVVAVRFSGYTLDAASLGDSRLYRIREGKIEQLTEDDTDAWSSYRAGRISKDQIRTSKNRNFIRRAVGFEEDSLSDLQDTRHTIQLGDIYLLCTDGLWGELSDEHIKAKVEEAYRDYPDDDLAAAQTLVIAANAAGGRDNITAVVARVKGIPLEVLLERGLGSIEVDDTSLLRHFVDQYETRLKVAKQSKARFILAEYTARTKSDLPLVARDLYEEALERASPLEMREPYIGQTVSQLLKLYSLIYVREEGQLNGKEQTFFSKVLELREKASGYQEQATPFLCDAVERIAHRALSDYTGASASLAGIHTLIDPVLSVIPELENSFIDMYNRLAEKAIEAKDYATAYRFVKRISAAARQEDTFRTSALGRQNAFVVEIARGYFEEGNVTALQELAAQEKVPATFYDWGKDAFSKKRFEAAAAAFSVVTAQEPRNSWAHYYLGMTHHALGKGGLAEDAFTSAVKLRPAFATKDLEEAVGFIAAKDYRRAGWAAERAVHVASYSAAAPQDKILETLITLGVVYKEGKEIGRDHAVARRLFTAALSLDSSHVHAEYHLGTIAFMEKDYDTAEQHFEQVIRRNPKHRWAQYQLARVYEATGNSEARNHYQIATDLGLEQAQTALKQLQQ